MPKLHRVHHLYQTRLAQATKPFNARGAGVERCAQCRIDHRFCMCDLRPEARSEAGFVILFYDDEVLKPSNTGKLIADLFQDTYAFLWQRTEVHPQLIALLQNPAWFPIVVFPEEYTEPPRQVMSNELSILKGKRPLFILLDGSWREAKKMFRKSPYLDAFPVVSIAAEQRSQYLVRKAVKEQQLATAEVASFVVELMGEAYNAKLLRAWFDLFSYRYQQGVMRKNKGDETAQMRLQDLINSPVKGA